METALDWQQIRVSIDTDATIQQLRLDVSDGAGEATIQKLQLLDSDDIVPSKITMWVAAPRSCVRTSSIRARRPKRPKNQSRTGMFGPF